MKSEGAKNKTNIDKIAFKVVQMKFLAMHITNQKWTWYIYCRKFTKYLHWTWSYLIFWWFLDKIVLTHTMYLFIIIYMHLADAFIQNDLQCIQVIHFLSVCVPWESNPQPFNAMLYHWTTGNSIVGYCYKYTWATYDWFCDPGSHMVSIKCHLYI